MRFGAIFVLVALLAVTTPVIFAEELSLEMVLEVPAPPTNLIASSGLPIDLSWTASPEPNPDMPVTHYSIEKSVNGGLGLECPCPTRDASKSLGRPPG